MLTITSFSVSGYRSLRRVDLAVDPLTVVVGANGAGKTNLYRALQLLQAAATGDFAREIAAEGGMASAVWAGRRPVGKPVRIELSVDLVGAATAGVYRYAVDAGVPQPTAAAFELEPHVKSETLVFVHKGRARKLLERRGPLLTAWDERGDPHEVVRDLLPSATGLAAIEAASSFPDQHLVRRTLLDWRFYHEMRTDAASPLRQPALAVTTPTLASDGRDLAAVFATLQHIREDMADVAAAVADAFPGSRLDLPRPRERATFGLTSADFLSDGGRPRVFAAGELSDGTLRYLGLIGALLADRLPAFIALNEPEASLHPDLMAPLARLVRRAAERTQVWVVTHSESLATALREGGAASFRVAKRAGESEVEVD